MGKFIACSDLFSCPRMRSVIHLREMLEVEVGVDLRTADTGMAKQLLHGPQVPAGLQQMARKAVAQHVRMNVHAQSERAGALPEPAGNTTRAQPATAAGDKERRLGRLRDSCARRQPRRISGTL